MTTNISSGSRSLTKAKMLTELVRNVMKIIDYNQEEEAKNKGN